MNSENLPLQRYDRFSEDELRVRLEREQRALEQQGQTERARLLHELAVYQIELEMQNRELREAQNALETTRDQYADLFDHAPVGYVTVDAKGYVQRANFTAAELLHTTQTRMQGQPFGIYISKQDLPRFFAHLREVFEGTAPMADVFTMRSLDGHTTEVRLTSRARIRPQPSPPLCRIAIADLTEQRRAEAQARAHHEALAHAARLSTLGEMATGLAHELGQPLTAVQTYAQAARRLLSTDSTDAEQLDEILEKITRQAERATETLDGIRRFARREPPRSASEDLYTLVNQTMALLETELRSARVQVKVSGDESAVRIYADRILVQQVLVNLVHNAVEACRGTPGGQINIDVLTASREWVQVAVTDNGPGIADAQREFLFEPFRTTKPQGLGIGLSLSRSLVETMGGSLWLDASSDQGTTFKFTLPARKDQ